MTELAALEPDFSARSAALVLLCSSKSTSEKMKMKEDSAAIHKYRWRIVR